MTRFLIVRHGQSEWNADGRWQGQADPPLTDLGREQAARAARSLGGFDAIFASPLDRAATTAAIISEELGIGPVVHMPGLMERDAGEWSGLTRKIIDERFPGYLDQHRRPPGWESDEAVEARVMGALERMAEQHRGGTVLVVAHGGVVYALEAILGAPFERLANLGARWLVLTDDAWTLGERVHLITSETVPDQI